MKIKTSELKDEALNWATAIAYGMNINFLKRNPYAAPEYSKSWDKCGELIDKYEIWFSNADNKSIASAPPHMNSAIKTGETPKIAICRAVVAMEFGDEVDIPDDLVGEDE